MGAFCTLRRCAPKGDAGRPPEPRDSPLFSFRLRANALRRKLRAQGRNRTADTGIFNPLLYQLSYLGTALPTSRRAAATSIASHRAGCQASVARDGRFAEGRFLQPRTVGMRGPRRPAPLHVDPLPMPSSPAALPEKVERGLVLARRRRADVHPRCNAERGAFVAHRPSWVHRGQPRRCLAAHDKKRRAKERAGRGGVVTRRRFMRAVSGDVLIGEVDALEVQHHPRVRAETAEHPIASHAQRERSTSAPIARAMPRFPPARPPRPHSKLNPRKMRD